MRCKRLCGHDYRLYGGTTAIDEPQADEVVGGITIRVRQRNVIISGLKVGDMVDIYDPTGRVYNMIRATGRWSHRRAHRRRVYHKGWRQSGKGGSEVIPNVWRE